VSYSGTSPTTSTGTLTGTGTVIATSGSSANSDYMVIGTWTAGTWTGASPATITSTGFAAGIPSTSATLTALSGQRATYALQNSTPVYSSTSANGSFKNTSALSVDFTSTSAYMDVNLDITMPTEIYKLRGGISGFSSGFNGVVTVSSDDCIAGTITCGVAKIAGGFSGPNASALLSFGATSSADGSFGGAAIFNKTSLASTPNNNAQAGLQINVADGSNIAPGSAYASKPSPLTTVTTKFLGEKLLEFSEAATATVTLTNNTPAGGTYGALGVISDSDFLGWGNWVTGTKSTTASTNTDTLNSTHYLVGRPTPGVQMPTTGTAVNYVLVGGTAPTATSGGVTTTGQLVSASMTANFVASTATASINTMFSTTAVNITNHPLTIVPAAATFSGVVNNPSPPSVVTVSGFFTGDKAYRAGLVYSTNQNGALGQVTGAVALQKGN
jgi:hypothetical protein